ncbi:MAG: sulfite exporter TauE/SafE family protein [Anaerolineae bacterium]|nr:sulfite exporter TauE/SafE family protein [Anaerolineae bacterium]
MEISLIMALAAFYVGLVKGGLGPVPGALLVPLLSTQMAVADAVALTLPLLLVGDWFALPVYWRKWDSRALWLMIPAGIAGVLMGVLLLSSLPDIALRRVLGGISLLAVAYKLGSDSLASITYVAHDWHGWLAGWGSGFMSAMANAGAPPITAYLLLRSFKPVQFIATTVVFFLTMNLVKLPVFLATGVLDAGEAVKTLWVLPLIPLGVWLGKSFLERVDARKFDLFMLILLAWAGVSLLLG